MELISREAVLNIIKGRYTIEEHDLAKDILSLPTIESRPKGKWLDKNIIEITCSACNEDVPQEFYNCNYCPNCGAEMESE